MSLVLSLFADYRSELLLAVLVVGELKELLAVDVLKRQNLAVHSGLDHALGDILLGRAVEHRRHYLPAELLRRDAEVYLEHLSYIHSGRHAHRVENDVERGTVS